VVVARLDLDPDDLPAVALEDHVDLALLLVAVVEEPPGSWRRSPSGREDCDPEARDSLALPVRSPRRYPSVSGAPCSKTMAKAIISV